MHLQIPKRCRSCTMSTYYTYANKPSKQRPYTYNENFVNKIKYEIDKLLEAEFIYEIEHTEWDSPKFVVPEKNKKL